MQPDLAKLILEVADDEVPLLVSDNNGTRNIPQDLRSLMMVPLKIRQTVFGVLMAALVYLWRLGALDWGTME